MFVCVCARAHVRVRVRACRVGACVLLREGVRADAYVRFFLACMPQRICMHHVAYVCASTLVCARMCVVCVYVFALVCAGVYFCLCAHACV